MIQSTSYVFRTNGMPWAMDIALRSAVGLTNATDELPRLLSDVEYMLITHGHEDHFERETVQCLLQCRMKWVIPHFLLDMAHDFGLKDEQIIIVNRGQELHLGELRVMSFEGQHYRPSNHVGIDELGYCISAKDSPTLLFPGDTRDFSCEKLPHFDHVDWIFGHVWLGDEDSRIADRKGMDTVFANHLMHFNPQGAVLAHLYETSRNDKQMWRYCHAGLVADRLREISPDIKIKVPLPGEITDLPIIN